MDDATSVSAYCVCSGQAEQMFNTQRIPVTLSQSKPNREWAAFGKRQEDHVGNDMYRWKRCIQHAWCGICCVEEPVCHSWRVRGRRKMWNGKKRARSCPNTSGIQAHHSCAVPLATGFPLSPLLNTPARGLSPQSFGLLSSSLVFMPLTLHLFPPLPRFLFSFSLSFCSPSLQPLQSVLFPRGPRYPPTPFLPPQSLPSSPPFSV